MSSVRMCDNCGFIFSENAEGWSNMTGNRMVKNADTGKMEAKNASVDYCPDCTEAMTNGGVATRPQSPAPQKTIAGKAEYGNNKESRTRPGAYSPLHASGESPDFD